MARQRSPNSLEAEQLYLTSKGKLELVEIAKQLQVSPGTVRSWKNRYKWSDKLKDKSNATLQIENDKNKCNVAKDKVNAKSDTDVHSTNLKNKKNSNFKTNTKRKIGAPKGNRNAVGNKGGIGGPLRNKNAEKHGLFAKYLPEETLEVILEIKEKNPLDILWENITIQYAAIIRSQKIMYVTDQEDTSKVLKKQKEAYGATTDNWGKEYEIQFAWDKQATFLNAQSRAMGELRNLVKQYDELLHKNWDLATEEQKARIQKLKLDIENTSGSNKGQEQVVIVDDI